MDCCYSVGKSWLNWNWNSSQRVAIWNKACNNLLSRQFLRNQRRIRGILGSRTGAWKKSYSSHRHYAQIPKSSQDKTTNLFKLIDKWSHRIITYQNSSQALLSLSRSKREGYTCIRNCYKQLCLTLHLCNKWLKTRHVRHNNSLHLKSWNYFRDYKVKC